MRIVLNIFLILFVIACSDIDNKAVKTADSLVVEKMPDQISHDVEVIFIDSSYTKAVLYAKRARIYQDRMETLLDSGLKVLFYSKETGQRISRLTADSARIDDRTKNMLAMGNVVVISDSNMTKLETPELEWINARQLLYSTAKVKITTANEIINGRGFESDPKLDRYKIKNVSGITQIEN